MNGELDDKRLLELHVSDLEKQFQGWASTVGDIIKKEVAAQHKRTRKRNGWGVAVLALVGTFATVGGTIYTAHASTISREETRAVCTTVATDVGLHYQESTEQLLLKYQDALLRKVDVKIKQRNEGAPMGKTEVIRPTP
jgi:hypothetical protein